jgi:peptidoglycan/LPS O-acetylase OafA/YrhL
MAWAVMPQLHSGPPTGRSIVVYGLLLQDVVVAPVPNGAFWSIAVEAELYLVFPLLLILRRRLGAAVVLATVFVPVMAMGLLAPGVSPVDKLGGLAPQLAPLFTMGLVAAGVSVAGRRVRCLPWQWLAALCAAPVIVLVLLKGSVWTVRHYFWIDLAVGPAMAMLLAAVSTGRPAALVWLLESRPVRGLGRFSYSLYLTQLPIVLVVSRTLVAPHVASGLPAFWATLAVAAPVSLATARLFAAVFEIPFQRYHSWPDLKAAVLAQRPTPSPGRTAAAQTAIPQPVEMAPVRSDRRPAPGVAAGSRASRRGGPRTSPRARTTAGDAAMTSPARTSR